MIEYALLFALGFLTAALIAVAIAPAIHRRVVAYTERRIYATMPISPAEVRAQKDMERAAFATEAARLGDDLRRERDARLAAQKNAEDATAETARLTAEHTELHHHIEEMNTTAADLRAEARRATMHNGDLKAALNLSQTTIDTLRREIDLHEERARRLEADVSGCRIDLAARDAEIENLNSRMQALRHERDALRADYTYTSSNLSSLERRSGQSEGKLARLEQKALRQAADLADMENRLERRTREADRLRDRLRDALKQKESYRMTLKSAGIEEPNATGEASAETAPADSAPHQNTPDAARLKQRGERLMQRILDAADDSDDHALREELAELAAAVTAHAGEGKAAQRVRDILIASPPYSGRGRIGLASRIKTAMAERELGRRL